MPRIPKKEDHTPIIWSRVDAVVGLMLENDRYLSRARTKELIETVKEKFNIAERTAFRYVSEAKKVIRKISRENTANAFNRAMLDREFLFAKAKNSSDYKLALQIVQDRDKLRGLYIDKSTQDVTVKKVDLSIFTDYGLERLSRNEPVELVMQDPKSIKPANV